jgi:LasA protease
MRVGTAANASGKAISPQREKMKNTNLISLVRKTLSGIILLGVLFSAFGAGGLAIASAQGTDAPQPAGTLTAGHILSDGQFVFGPNVGDFDLKNYLASNAPHLLKYADDITGRAEYYSINPKILLTLLEMQAQIISKPNTAHIEDPFGLNTGGFIAQIETLSSKMADAYYLHLYSYSPLLVSQRILPAFAMRDGQTVDVAPDTNAGSYAIMAGLAAIGWHDFSLALDNSQAQGFYQTYTRLFGNDDPLDERNRIAIPGTVSALVAPENLLQLPFLRGLSWKFGGVHNNSAGSTGSPLTDASAMDFYPSGSTWNIDTSSMWVVAAAAGVPTKISACYFKIVHSDGWETTYYHLENVQTYAGSINQNDKIGVIANTLPEAICSGGASSGPHVHFTLKHNGALVAINGTALAGWVVHSGRWCYDTDPNYMWLVRSGQKKYAFSDTVLSEGVSNPPQISSISRDATDLVNVKFIVTFTSAVTGVDAGDFSLTTSGLTGAVVSGLIGSGSSYTVTVNPGSGTGTLRLDAVDNDSILDLAGVPLGGVGTGNGNFSSGETVIINRTPGTFIISGNAGVGGATLSYTDGVPKSAVANASGLTFWRCPLVGPELSRLANRALYSCP